MKKNLLLLLTAILTCGFCLMSCTVQEDNPIVPEEPQYPANFDVFATLPGNAGDPAVVAALKTLENVEDLKPFENVNLGQAYFFNYKQLVDHNDPSKGTFKQQVVLTFVSKDAPTILHTQGYALTLQPVGQNHNRLDSIGAPDLLWTLSKNGADNIFDFNSVQVEYRYHGFSLPEGETNSFKYLSAEQQSKDLHAIVTDLKKALITGSGKWLSTGVSKNGMTTAQYAYYDEVNNWNDIDVYVPFVAPIPPVEFDLRIGTYMLTQSSKAVLPDLEKAYRKLVDDKAIADATIEAFKEKFPSNSQNQIDYYTVATVAINNLFAVQSYGDIDTWKQFIPTENSTPEEYATFFMLNENDERIYRKTNRRAAVERQDPFAVQIGIDQGNLGYDYTWLLDGKLLTDDDKAALRKQMDGSKNSKAIDLEVKLLENLKTTKKHLVFVYGENDPWTGAAIPNPTNPNIKKYIVPNGTHTDNFAQYAWYPGGKEVADQILADIKAWMNQ